MDAASIFIVAITLAIFVVPIWYYNGLQRRNDAKLRALFLESAGKQDVRPQQQDLWNNRYAIGLDPQSNRLFYLKKTADRIDKFVVELAGIESCRVVSTRRNVALATGTTTVTDRLALGFRHRSRQTPDLEVEFFLSDEGNSLNQEYSLAEKWAGIVNKQLATPT